MFKQPTERDAALWRDFVAAHRALIMARMALHGPDVDRVALLRRALRDGEQATAVEMMGTLQPAELQQLFDELVFLSLSHGYALKARDLIGSLPRDWVLSHIEEAAEVHLREGTYDEYRRILELYAVLDDDLTRRLARRAIEHRDSDIREAGADFIGE